MRTLIRGVLGLAFLVTTTGSSLAMCDPTGADAADVAAARAAIDANCDCAGSTHGAYVSCAAGQAQATLANQSCRGKVVSCAARSTCGKLGFVLCCRTNAMGNLKCSPKSSCGVCMPPGGGSACCSDPASGGQTSCCGPTGVDKTGACSDPSCVATP